MSDESDIRDVINEEKAQLKPARAEARRKHAKRLRQAEKLLKRGTEEELIELIRTAGLREDSLEAKKALQIWRENRS